MESNQDWKAVKNSDPRLFTKENLKIVPRGKISISANFSHYTAEKPALPAPFKNQEDQKKRKEHMFQLSHKMPITENSE